MSLYNALIYHSCYCQMLRDQLNALSSELNSMQLENDNVRMGGGGGGVRERECIVSE